MRKKVSLSAADSTAVAASEAMVHRKNIEAAKLAGAAAEEAILVQLEIVHSVRMVVAVVGGVCVLSEWQVLRREWGLRAAVGSLRTVTSAAMTLKRWRSCRMTGSRMTWTLTSGPGGWKGGGRSRRGAMRHSEVLIAMTTSM